MAEKQPLPETSDPIVKQIMAFRHEADDARRARMFKNRRNRDIFFGRQDWSHKQKGQSAEFLPKVPNSVEQMAAFVKRGLVQFGDWFSIDVDRTLAKTVEGTQLRTVLKCFLDNLWTGNNNTTTLPLVVSDAVKVALLESLMIAKIHGGYMPRRVFSRAEDGSMKIEETSEWRLRIDLIRPEDYYPDPSGNGLYEIHSCERDLHEVLAAAEGDNAIYNRAEVQKLIDTDFTKPLDEKRTARDRNQLEETKPTFRKRVVLDEFWGTLLNEDGTVLQQNVVATVANKKYLIRKPESNPFWHGKSPFVVAPLLRVPWSVWHKALYDHASDLNLAINEMFNLIVDGGLAAVWGVRQIRIEDLEDPSQVADGIPQGATLAVKQTLPYTGKVLETVSTGNVPQDALAIFEFLNREYSASALTNELKLGALPQKQVRATEVVEASQSQAITLDGVVADIEHGFMRPLLERAWLTVLQNADEIPDEALTGLMDRQVATLVMRASPEERFALFAGKAAFKVNGLSGTMARALEFQKFMALMQSISQNPLLLQAFVKEYSASKTVRYLMRTLGINTDDMKKDSEEMAREGEEMQRFGEMSALLNGGGEAGGVSAPGASDPSGAPLNGGSDLPAQVNQLSNSRNGLTPNA